jgi:hypothetical protein
MLPPVVTVAKPTTPEASALLVPAATAVVHALVEPPVVAIVVLVPVPLFSAPNPAIIRSPAAAVKVIVFSMYAVVPDPTPVPADVKLLVV